MAEAHRHQVPKYMKKHYQKNNTDEDNTDEYRKGNDDYEDDEITEQKLRNIFKDYNLK